jgi:hypothetical protein
MSSGFRDLRYKQAANFEQPTSRGVAYGTRTGRAVEGTLPRSINRE